MFGQKFVFFVRFSLRSKRFQQARSESELLFRPRDIRASTKKEKKFVVGRGEEGKETLADKPLDFENHPLTITPELSHIDQWARGSRITGAKIVTLLINTER